MHVGRTVSGLPNQSASFAILPPFFPQSCSDLVKKCLPSIPHNLIRIGEFALASVVFHSDFLLAIWPKTHPALDSHLFRDLQLLNSLKQIIICRNYRPEDPISPTGIPPHIALLEKMETIISDYQLNQNHLIPIINSIPLEVAEKVTQILEERAIGAGTVTYTGLKEMLSVCLENAGVTTLVQHLENRQTVEPKKTEEVTFIQIHSGNGRFNMLPENFKLPDCTLIIAFQHWCYPNVMKNQPALRKIEGKDIVDPVARKRFSDYKLLFFNYLDSL